MSMTPYKVIKEKSGIGDEVTTPDYTYHYEYIYPHYIICPQCGHFCVNGDRYCSICGEKLIEWEYCPTCGNKM